MRRVWRVDFGQPVESALSIPGREPDRILVIQDGTLIESGTHDELYQQENGLYRHLAELQFNLKH